MGPSKVWEKGPCPRSCRRAAARTRSESCRSSPKRSATRPATRVRPQRVLEPRVIGAGEHEMGEASLPNAPETLERFGADEGEGRSLENDRAVDRVEDRLAPRRAVGRRATFSRESR